MAAKKSKTQVREDLFNAMANALYLLTNNKDIAERLGVGPAGIYIGVSSGRFESLTEQLNAYCEKARAAQERPTPRP